MVGLLAASPGLTVLVTSRGLLRLSDERAYPILPLALAASEHLADVAVAPATRLFVARA